MNLFASSTFLGVVASVYFQSRPWCQEDHVLDGKVFRLLKIAGLNPMTTHPFVDMHEPVGCRPDASPSTTVRWLPNASHGIMALKEFTGNPLWNRFSGAPTTLWQDFPTWGDYCELLRQRNLLRDDQRRRRRLEELVGPLTFSVDDLGADVLPTTFQWKSAQWRRLTGIDLFAQAQNREFFHELRARGLLLASTLRAGSRLLASWLGAVFEKRWYGWIFAFNPDPALAKYSVGRQLLYPMLEESYRAGHKEFDFSAGCEPYKLFFATHVRAIGPAGILPVRYRLEWMLRDRLRSTPQVYEKVKAVRLAFQREVFRVSCMRSPSRADQRVSAPRG